MSRKEGRKFGVEEFRIDGVKYTQEIRVSTQGKLRLWSTLPSGQVVEGTDHHTLQKDIREALAALMALKWERLIVVDLDMSNGELFERRYTTGRDPLDEVPVDNLDAWLRTNIRRGVGLRWGVRYRATNNKGEELWKKELSDERSDRRCDVGYGDNKIILPWTQETQDFLVEVTNGLAQLGNRIHRFFHAPEVEKRIADALSCQKLLGGGEA